MVGAGGVKSFIGKAKFFYNVSERRLCSLFKTHRSTVRYVKRDVDEESRLISDMHRLAQKIP